jgi:hypothetical protein
VLTLAVGIKAVVAAFRGPVEEKAAASVPHAEGVAA